MSEQSSIVSNESEIQSNLEKNRIELDVDEQWDRLIILESLFAFIFLINCTVLLTLVKRDETQIIYFNQTKWVTEFDGNLKDV